MDIQKWNSLPPDLQKALESVSGEKAAVLLAEAHQSDAIPGRKYCQETGKEFNTLTPQELSRWAEASKPVWDEWLARVGSKGIDGQKILNRAIELAKKY